MATVSGRIDLTTADGQFLALFLGAVAKKESDDKSRRILRKHEELAMPGARSRAAAADRMATKPTSCRVRSGGGRSHQGMRAPRVVGESLRSIVDRSEPAWCGDVDGGASGSRSRFRRMPSASDQWPARAQRRDRRLRRSGPQSSPPG